MILLQFNCRSSFVQVRKAATNNNGALKDSVFSAVNLEFQVLDKPFSYNLMAIK